MTESDCQIFLKRLLNAILFKCPTCLNDTHFCLLYIILKVVSYYILSGMLIIVAVHREGFFIILS